MLFCIINIFIIQNRIYIISNNKILSIFDNYSINDLIKLINNKRNDNAADKNILKDKIKSIGFTGTNFINNYFHCINSVSSELGNIRK